jgi:hypothetical protein
MSENAGLYRSYQRLLTAYPRSYRRVREIEILTTLMDAAPPSRQRATLREGLDLLGGGVRYRLRVPPGPAYRVVAVVAALLGALLVAGGAVLATWNLADTEPSPAQADAAARDAVAGDPPEPLLHPTDQLHLDALGMETSPGDEGYTGPAPAPLAVTYTFPLAPAGPWPNEPAAALALVTDRLVAAGWRVDEPVVNEGSAVFWAHRDDLAVQVSALVGDQAPNQGGSSSRGDPVSVWLNVHRVAPMVVNLAAVVGTVLGGLLGWLYAAWVLRAFGRHTQRGRGVLALVGVVTLLVGAVGLITPTLLSAVGLAFVDGWSPHDSLVPASTLWSSPLLTLATLVGLAIVGLVAVAAPRNDDQVAPVAAVPRSGSWVLVLGLVVGALVCGGLVTGFL